MTADKTEVAVMVSGRPLHTPAKLALRVPTQALADAIAAEHAAASAVRYACTTHPLTALACTALDRIAPQKEAVVEALMAYVDTDTLSYRSATPALSERQEKEWDPIVSDMGRRFGGIWQITSGINALEQPAVIHAGLRAWLSQKDAMPLAAIAVLASGFSSIALAVAVAENGMSAESAFALSRLEEEFQAERWGQDEEAARRARAMQAESVLAARFLSLLEATDRA